VCFLCRKGLDGWEKGDDPLVEHVKHAPNCGWAILAAIEAEYPDYLAEDPKSKRMIDARKSTFVGRWPHEAKKGWKCKTKQVSLSASLMLQFADCPAFLHEYEKNSLPRPAGSTHQPQSPMIWRRVRTAN